MLFLYNYDANISTKPKLMRTYKTAYYGEKKNENMYLTKKN